MSYSDVEHFATMLAGCEAINMGQYKGAEAMYAQTVLKLHVNDAGLYAGQEGFLDAVKKGASKTKDWIVKMIKAIRDWLSKVKAAITRDITIMVKGGDAGIKSELLRTTFAHKVSSWKGELEQMSNETTYDHLDESGIKEVKWTDAIKELKAFGTMMEGTGKFDVVAAGKHLQSAMGMLSADLTAIAPKADAAASAIPNDAAAPEFTKANKHAMVLGNICQKLAEITNRMIRAVEEFKVKLDKAAGKEEKEVNPSDDKSE